MVIVISPCQLKTLVNEIYTLRTIRDLPILSANIIEIKQVRHKISVSKRNASYVALHKFHVYYTGHIL